MNEREAFKTAYEAAELPTFDAGWKAALEWRDSQNQQMNQPLVHALEQILEWAGPPTGSEFGTFNRISLMAGAALATVKKEQTK